MDALQFGQANIIKSLDFSIHLSISVYDQLINLNFDPEVCETTRSHLMLKWSFKLND